jgi:hypothetical protein
VINVSDDSYVAKVVTTILNGLHHTSLLGSNPILSSDNPPAGFRRKIAAISMFP